MIVYVGAGDGPLRRPLFAAGHGIMVSRQAGAWRLPRAGVRWAFDNGAYADWKNGEPFDGEEFERRVAQIMALAPDRRPDWCVVPDKVAAGAESLDLSVGWRARLADDLPWYLVVQDGMTERAVGDALQSDLFDGLFVGGTSPWKNATAAEWVRFAHARRLPCHVGRVNGPRRLQWAVNIGADSIDGTGWTRQPRWIAHLLELPSPEPMLEL